MRRIIAVSSLNAIPIYECILMIQIKEDKLIYPELSYAVTGECFEVHNELGRYCREKQYCDAIEKRLKTAGTRYEREFKIKTTGNTVDFLIDKKMILEIKAKPLILKEDYFQVQRYLQASNIRLALLINFRNRYLKPTRIVRIDTTAKERFN